MTIYSHSRLGTFENCPRHFWYSYIGKPEIERVDGIEAFTGSRAHDALEELYKRHMNGHMMDVEELLACYEAGWESNWHDNVQIVNKTYCAEDYREVGRGSLRLYYSRYHPFDQSQTLQLEARILINLDGDGKYKLQGYIDRLAQRRDGAYEIHDYKTSSRMPTQKQADRDRQLALYQLGVQGMWDDVNEVELIWHYLRFDKEIRSRRTPGQLETIKNDCIAVIDDIESRGRDEANFPTKKTRLCDWCEYRELCPATRHRVAVAKLPPEKFDADAGVGLVDELADILDNRHELEEQVDALKEKEADQQERIIAFAQQEGLESVAGSSFHVDITERMKIDYPKSGDERRDDFEQALHKSGLWDRLTALNWSKLKSLWKEKDSLSPQAREEIEDYITEIINTVAKLKKGGGREE